MSYLGGKSRIARYIAKYINHHYAPKVYAEAFCGMCWVGLEIKSEVRLFSDINQPLITMWESLLGGWTPPSNVNESLYREVRDRMDPFDPLTAFIGFGCSFGGKFFGGYARSNDIKRNYAENAKNSLLAVIPKLMGVEFACLDYGIILEMGADVIYCDPPYENTTGYAYTDGLYNSHIFWDKVRSGSDRSVILVSEYNAPDDFDCVASFNTITGLRDSDRKPIPRTEKLFKYRYGKK